MAREWSLQTVTNLKFREMEKMLIEVFGCIPVDFKRVIRLDIRKGRPMALPEVNLGSMEKTIMEIFGCISPDKHVIEFDAGKNKKKTIVKSVHDEGEHIHYMAHSA